MSVCIFKKYSNIFGAPNTGAHAWRFLNTAGVDYILTIIIACVTPYFTKMPLVMATLMWFIIGLVCHILFGVNTNITKYLGLHC